MIKGLQIMIKILLPLLLLAASHFSQAQLKLSGKVTDSESGEAMQFVNIGIRGLNTGTITNQKGDFSLQLADKYLQDSITFSFVGYADQIYPIRELAQSKNIAIALRPKDTQLQEVVVSKKVKWKKDKAGVNRYFGSQYGFDAGTKDRHLEEVGQMLDLGEEPAKIVGFNIYLADFIKEGDLDSLVFRINFYKFEGNRTQTRVFEKEILDKRAFKRGWLKVDLEDYNIWLDGQVMAAIEFLRYFEGKGSFVPLYGGILQTKGSSYTRRNSLGSWEQQDSGTYSIYVNTKKIKSAK